MRRIHLPLLGVLLLAACKPSPAKIEVAQENLLLQSKGDAVKIEATVKDREGKILPDAPITFKTMTPTMATVDPDGTVRAVTSGNATVLVQAGDVRKEVNVLVQIPAKLVVKSRGEGDFSSPVLMLGVTKGYSATVYNDRKEPMIAGDVTWEVSDPEILKVDKLGNIKTLKEGECTLTAHAAGLKGSLVIKVKHEELTEEGLLVQ